MIRTSPGEHWEAAAVAAVHRDRERDPSDWQAVVDDADDASRADAESADEWQP